MTINTRIFGEINIDEEKIITFQNGIVGFPDLKDFALIYDEEKGTATSIRWLQSVQAAEFALPVMDPLIVYKDYNPEVDDELLQSAGALDSNEMLVLVTLTVPNDIKTMSINLKAPIVINAKARKACQVIAEGDNYPVKFQIYELLQALKSAK